MKHTDKQWLRSGNTLNSINFVTPPQKKLEVGNYLVKYNDMKGVFYLQDQPEFSLPEKLYGKKNINIYKKYLASYDENNSNCGILLAGLKGTGKSIMAQKTCIESKRPVIIIRDNFSRMGSAFIDFIGSIEQECLIFIDEFEKIYDRDSQKVFLNLMDTTYSHKKMFILTSNKSYINEYLTNRTGRIKYKKLFGNIDKKMRKEIIEDLLVDKDKYKKELLETLDVLSVVTPDIMKAIIKDLNQFGGKLKKIIGDLNIELEDSIWEGIVTYKDKVIGNLKFDGHPTNLKSADNDTSLYVKRNSVEVKDKKGKLRLESSTFYLDSAHITNLKRCTGGYSCNVEYYGLDLKVQLKKKRMYYKSIY